MKMSVLSDRERSVWDGVLDEYEAHLARQEAHLDRLATRPDGEDEPEDDTSLADPGPFVPPAGLPLPPARVLARLIDLRERTALLAARSESSMRALRPERRSRLGTPESTTASLLDRQM